MVTKDSSGNESGGTEGLAFRGKGENFDRMVVSVMEDPTNYNGSMDDPVGRTGRTFAHEAIGHLFNAHHNPKSDEGQPERTSLLAYDGGQGVFFPSDREALVRGDMAPMDLPPGMPPGSKKQVDAIDSRPASGRETRRAHNEHDSKAEVYRWKSSVKN